MASQYAPRSRNVTPIPASVAASRVDSGYGSSVASGSTTDGDHLPRTILDPTHQHSDQTRQWTSHVHQLAYNQNRIALGRSVNRAVDTLKDFQRMNSKQPVNYPTVEVYEPQPSLNRTQTFADDYNNLPGPSNRPQIPRRAVTSIDLEGQQAEPLVAPKISEDFNVLKLDLKLGGHGPSALVHTLEKSSVAALLDGKINQSIKHLLALRERIEDTSSKVLVTGDVNAGKSTFCNALMRRRVLPEDQQPCTSAFCEVLDCQLNNDLEEVHAIREGVTYDRHDESSYDVYTLEQLEDLVVDNDEYHQVKVYVNDVRPLSESFLRNGVVDIALIDAPGLNTDSIKTTSVFARQEEIDVVVYVVAAENHFTLSAKEFIENAAKEKAYIFIVVNRFDNIRPKGRDKCQKAILEQIEAASPQTFREAEELVHFVSSNAVVEGQDIQKLRDFENLEQNLRSFVLEKRARSKLAPAKTYLMNLLKDIETLAFVNKEVAAAQLERIRKELDEISPAFERLTNARQEVSDDCDKTTDSVANEVYKFSRNTISKTIEHLDDRPVVPYAGILDAFGYAEATKQAMLQHVQSSVTTSEDYARQKTTEGVSSISARGILHLGDEYIQKAFRPESMFSRKRDALNKMVKIELDVTDFIDWDFASTQEKQIAGAGMSLTLATMAGSQLFGVGSWVDGLWKVGNLLGFRNAKKLILPVVLVATVGTGYYILQDLPNAVPRKLAKKIRKSLADLDYVHINADRIAQQCRKVLKFPTEDLRAAFQRGIEKQEKAVKERKQTQKDCDVADKYFGNLLRNAKQQRAAVSSLDLEPHTILEGQQEEQQQTMTELEQQQQQQQENPLFIS
ncbi:Similar to Transmembrane GTPase fzo1; acc. no. Q9USY7 [Pyronema omphalodes CBS 100304]|uniref:Similar to Transmembrane GTPase fzo1 acc. no. Q9USY7 n=1 Tax=Pyronema omphalodes (strain CBS 100304) TaxID=1076935 RepID=U4LAH6_PYROM|nr:Similar to Transmembrane GTPase fzo1; acc. no. Q9USY7 [Pyronema omphalodes CBS 100304]